MSGLNKPGVSGSPPKRQERITTPPRTLPTQADESSANFFNSWQPQQLSSNSASSGLRSPGRPKTLKDLEEESNKLKQENYNLKVRIYFLEQSRLDNDIPKDAEELRNLYTDLKVQHEVTKKDLTRKEDLLLNTYRALEAQKSQIDLMKTEKEDLLSKVDTLEKELNDYHVRFMETSLKLDTTTDMYRLLMGGNGKQQDSDSLLDAKVKELESSLEKEKEYGVMLEQTIKDQKKEYEKKCLHLKEMVGELEQTVLKLMDEKNRYDKLQKEALYHKRKIEEAINDRNQIIQEKDCELDNLKTILIEQEKERDSLKERLQADFQKQWVSLQAENAKLKQEIRHRSPNHEREQAKIEELEKKLEDIKNNKPPKHIERLIQTLIRENKILERDLKTLKADPRISRNHSNSSKEEIGRNIDEVTEMTTEKDRLILELRCKIEELTDVINEKESRLQEYKEKLDSSVHTSEKSERDKTSISFSEHSIKLNKDNELLSKELEEKKKEVEILNRELRKRTFNLQGLVNTELWDKNREIEKLNKVCERQHLEVLTLRKELKEYQLTLVKSNVSGFVSPVALRNSFLTEDKENLQPLPDATMQLQQLMEEKRLLMVKVEELEARLLNTPERDTESLLVQTLRAERDQAEKMRKETLNACILLTTRLQELADFLDSLLPSLCGKKRKVVQQAVERSRELSRSLSLAAEESTLHCSAWTDLQPSLYVSLLPDISTVDFWSGDESQEEAFLGGEEVARLKSQVETLTEEVKQKDGELAKFQSENNFSTNLFSKPLANIDEHLAINLENNRTFGETPFSYIDIADITEGSLVDTSDQNIPDQAQPLRLSPEVKSSNIGKITLTSRKKNTSHASGAVDNTSKAKDKEGNISEYETWSEPDRDVSYARMGLKEESTNMNKSSQCKFDDTSETGNPSPKSLSSRKASELQRLQRKIQSLEEVNEALRSELVILHQLAPPSLSRQDKATSIEVEDHENGALLRLKEITNQLDMAESELSELKLEKENWNRKMEMLQNSLQQTSDELINKQCALLELENSMTQRLKEVEESYSQKCSQVEQKCMQLEERWLGLQKEKDELLERINESNQKIIRLTTDIETYQQEGKKNKQVQEELNHQLQQIIRQKDELQKMVAEQEQLLADAERERQELATQLIARDRQVSDLQKQLGHMELTSNELEAALRSQLDVATHQCAQFEAKLRDLDNCNQQIAHVERIKCELERRVAELEAVNSELEAKLGSLNFVKPPYSDCETDAGSSVVGSPRRACPPPLMLPPSPHHPYGTQRSQDLTSDYLSDPDAALSSPQSQTRNLWFPSSPHSHASASPDLGIESDQGRFSSLDSHAPKSAAMSIRGLPLNDLVKLEEENTQLRRNLLKTRHALEETLSQLTAANQHKRQYEAQLSAANQHKAKVERAICRQLHKTHSILKKARVNLEEDGKSEHN